MIEEEDVNDKLKFLENESWEETRFMFVKKETDEMDIDKNGEEENETTFMKRTKLQDEKVLKKQRKIEKDVALIQIDNDLEKKRKRQLSIEKKKSKKKSRKEQKNKTTNEEQNYASNVKEIDKKFETNFLRLV